VKTEQVSSAAVDRITDRLDAVGRTLTRLGGIDKQIAALRLEVQSWKATQYRQIEELTARVAELEAALAGGEGG
jgi:hypothetical protein